MSLQLLSLAAASVLDTHVHFANTGRFTYNCLPPGPGCSNATYPPWVHGSRLPADYAADSQGFADGIVYPRRALVAYAPLEDGEAAGGQLQQLRRLPLFRGVRRILFANESDQCWFLTPGFDAGLSLLAAAGAHFELLANSYDQFDCAVQLVSRAPANLTVVVQHVGGADLTQPVGSPKWFQWLRYVQSLAALPNTVMKVSGVPERAVGKAGKWDGWTPEQVLPYVRAAADAFGWGRLFFGGNWFVVDTFSTYSRWRGGIEQILNALNVTVDQRAAFFSGNAERVYRL
eukprot:TRINITY_DN7414_c0_g1_i3.p2 TRINITY_DN7414_c0_g1~~TRINITY_DN7414_c0_g1_i3.p2  ORF type:complete len:288 (+),score=97.09 TRINITY_DN7414_c0_g1_i3:586-1449(+)